MSFVAVGFVLTVLSNTCCICFSHCSHCGLHQVPAEQVRTIPNGVRCAKELQRRCGLAGEAETPMVRQIHKYFHGRR